MKSIAIIMGSDSDLPLARAAADALAELGIPHEARVLSAHRTPDALREYVLAAPARGVAAFICIAGMAAHLAGAVAGLTILPVVGVPAASGGLGGLDALLATAQMPPGVPVATVAVGGGRNAAILCAQMLAIHDRELMERLLLARAGMARAIARKDEDISKELGSNGEGAMGNG